MLRARIAVFRSHFVLRLHGKLKILTNLYDGLVDNLRTTLKTSQKPSLGVIATFFIKRKFSLRYFE